MKSSLLFLLVCSTLLSSAFAASWKEELYEKLSAGGSGNVWKVSGSTLVSALAGAAKSTVVIGSFDSSNDKCEVRFLQRARNLVDLTLSFVENGKPHIVSTHQIDLTQNYAVTFYARDFQFYYIKKASRGAEDFLSIYVPAGSTNGLNFTFGPDSFNEHTCSIKL